MMNTAGSAIRRVSGLALLALTFTMGCEGKFETVEARLQRRSAALARLPDEDKAWKEYVAPGAAEDHLANLNADRVLTLERSRQIALRYNPDIHASRARIDQALARIKEARAAYFPQVALSHNSNRTFQVPRTGVRLPVSTPTLFPNVPTSLETLDLNTLLQLLSQPLFGRGISTGPGSSFSQHTTTVSVNWTLFDGFAREATLLATKHTHGATAMALADAQRLLVRAVDEAYYQAQLAGEQIRIARADVEFSQDQLRMAQRRADAGRATKTDVLNFQVRLTAAQADEQAALGLYRNARTVLAELMGIDSVTLPEGTELAPFTEESEEELTPPNADQWVDLALATRPDLAQKEQELKAKTEEVRAAKGQYSPSVLLSGSHGFDRLHNVAYSSNDQASAGALEVRWQLFTGGFRTSRVRLREAERWQIAAELRRRRQKVSSEVRQAATSLKDAQAQVRLQRLSLDAARENRRIVEAEYQAGKASLVRLNEAQRDLIQTDVNLTLARIRLRQSWSDLRAAAATYDVDELPPPDAMRPADTPAD